MLLVGFTSGLSEFIMDESTGEPEVELLNSKGESRYLSLHTAQAMRWVDMSIGEFFLPARMVHSLFAY
jgi:hypothetical protein